VIAHSLKEQLELNNEIRFSSAAASVWPKILKEICARKNIRTSPRQYPAG
jgi:hypothetical protein